MARTELTIGEVATRTGVTPSALRYWERLGLLRAPGRVGGKRHYDPETVRLVSLIVLIKRMGFTLAETRMLLAGSSSRHPPPQIWCKLARDKLPEIEQTLVRAGAMKRILEYGLRCAVRRSTFASRRPRSRSRRRLIGWMP